jgi:thymidylate synthase (FAD)
MTATAEMKVQLIAATAFYPPPDVPWETDIDGGPALCEFAGRACYQLWAKPNPATAANADYLRHILDVGHLSVLEHGSVSFYITGVSRSLTHELIRHRHLSYSQLSQRYVDGRNAPMVEPDVIRHDALRRAEFLSAVHQARVSYESLDADLRRVITAGTGTLRRKQARQAARAVLPNATETRIVVTGNYRAWRHFIDMRATEDADVEIRALAVEILRQLQQAALNVFGDYQIKPLRDGTQVAASPYQPAEMSAELTPTDAEIVRLRARLTEVEADRDTARAVGGD